MARISTPCVRVCIIDPDTGLCEGCGRTTDEVMGWLRYTEAQRLEIMAGLEDRMRGAFMPAAADADEGR